MQGPPSDPNRNYGRLDFLQVLRDGDNIGADEEGAGVIDGLAGARSVTVSRDGSRVYVAGENDGAFTVFTRNEDVANPNFGTLRFVETSKDGIGNIDGLDQAYAVAVSPDDRHIYLAGLGDNAIAVFFRNRSSSCSASGTGDIRDAIDIAAGGTVTYTLTGTIDPSATSDLSNTAFVLPCRLGDDGTCSTTNASDPFGGRVPAGCDPVTDPSCVPAIAPYDCPTDGSDNNCSVDTDVLTPRGDVGLTKTNSQSTVVPGEEVTYTLVVDNDGPSNVTGARVLDDLSGIFELDEFGDPIVEWTCQAIPTGRLDFIESVADGALGIAALESPSSRGGEHRRPPRLHHQPGRRCGHGLRAQRPRRRPDADPSHRLDHRRRPRRAERGCRQPRGPLGLRDRTGRRFAAGFRTRELTRRTPALRQR